MVCPFSHDSTKPSGQDAGSSVERFAPVVSMNVPPPLSFVEAPCDAASVLSVDEVNCGAYVSQVAKSIVSFVMVNVVNLVSLLVVSKKPANAMSLIALPFVADANVSIASNSFCAVTGPYRAVSLLPNQVAG